MTGQAQDPHSKNLRCTNCKHLQMCWSSPALNIRVTINPNRIIWLNLCMSFQIPLWYMCYLEHLLFSYASFFVVLICFIRYLKNIYIIIFFSVSTSLCWFKHLLKYWRKLYAFPKICISLYTSKPKMFHTHEMISLVFHINWTLFLWILYGRLHNCIC